MRWISWPVLICLCKVERRLNICPKYYRHCTSDPGIRPVRLTTVGRGCVPVKEKCAGRELNPMANPRCRSDLRGSIPGVAIAQPATASRHLRVAWGDSIIENCNSRKRSFPHVFASGCEAAARKKWVLTGHFVPRSQSRSRSARPRLRRPGIEPDGKSSLSLGFAWFNSRRGDRTTSNRLATPAGRLGGFDNRELQQPKAVFSPRFCERLRSSRSEKVGAHGSLRSPFAIEVSLRSTSHARDGIRTHGPPKDERFLRQRSSFEPPLAPLAGILRERVVSPR